MRAKLCREEQPGVTGCLAPGLSVVVASVWWICSHPVRGGYRGKCCLSAWPAWEGQGRVIWASTGRHGPWESLWYTVNWSLWGQEPQPKATCSTRRRFSKEVSFIFTMTAENVEAGGKSFMWRWDVLIEPNSRLLFVFVCLFFFVHFTFLIISQEKWWSKGEDKVKLYVSICFQCKLWILTWPASYIKISPCTISRDVCIIILFVERMTGVL